MIVVEMNATGRSSRIIDDSEVAGIIFYPPLCSIPPESELVGDGKSALPTPLPHERCDAPSPDRPRRMVAQRKLTKFGFLTRIPIRLGDGAPSLPT